MTAGPRFAWAVIGGICVLTLAVVLLSWPGPPAAAEIVPPEGIAWTGDTVARVGETVLLAEDLALAGLDASAAGEWVEDELLAQLAVERGLGNDRLAALVQHRARQLYLRDAALSSAYASVVMPTDAEVLEFMRGDSELYMIERHYYHILLPDSALADSVHAELEQGDSFQIAAERLSLGQTAGVGGDLGFLTGGELTAFGLPREDVLITGLGRAFATPLGWHILMVEETRLLTDTVRVLHTLADVLYRQRLEEARSELLEEARRTREVRTVN